MKLGSLNQNDCKRHLGEGSNTFENLIRSEVGAWSEITILSYQHFEIFGTNSAETR